MNWWSCVQRSAFQAFFFVCANFSFFIYLSIYLLGIYKVLKRWGMPFFLLEHGTWNANRS